MKFAWLRAILSDLICGEERGERQAPTKKLVLRSIQRQCDQIVFEKKMTPTIVGATFYISRYTISAMRRMRVLNALTQSATLQSTLTLILVRKFFIRRPSGRDRSQPKRVVKLRSGQRFQRRYLNDRSTFYVHDRVRWHRWAPVCSVRHSL